MEMLPSFFKAKRIPGKICCGVCTDGASAMLGSKSVFQRRVKEVAQNAKNVQYIITSWSTRRCPGQNDNENNIKLMVITPFGKLYFYMCNGCEAEIGVVCARSCDWGEWMVNGYGL